MIIHKPYDIPPLRKVINDAYRMDEGDCVEHLLDLAPLTRQQQKAVDKIARALVEEVRGARIGKGGIDAFLYTYDLTSEEGIALMCLAEALLRVPDKDTMDRLIRDKITSADWEQHSGKSDSMFVNAATWALMLTGKIVTMEEERTRNMRDIFKRMAGRSGEPVIRKAVSQAMKILGRQFVMGRNIEEALERAKEQEAKGYRYSYDMLGEAAHTQEDANRYFESYQKAINTIGKASKGRGIIQGPGISIKLSALHPRYEFSQRERAIKEITPKLMELALQAKAMDMGLTVDAEEANRLDLSLDIIEKVYGDSALKGWEGFGLAVQSYQKRALPVIEWLEDLAHTHGRRMMVRLIKGAYWDSEIKVSQEMGFDGYPVFTRKASTDTSFIACAKRLLKGGKAFYPQFATHNAHSFAAIMTLAGENTDYEFQCLHGMGQTLYDQVVGANNMNRPCRVYAPVGSHEDLLPYLVRRLLENGANTSFVNRIVDAKAPISEIIADPIIKTAGHESKPHPNIALPMDIYGAERKNSQGVDLSNRETMNALAKAMGKFAQHEWRMGSFLGPVVKSRADGIALHVVFSPSHLASKVGEVVEADTNQVEQSMQAAKEAQPAWDVLPVEKRAECLEKYAELLEENQAELMTILVREAGKTLSDAIAELREAVDFCRYYAVQAKENFSQPTVLQGPTGEYNHLAYHGRGVIVCISPWNFPLAIFTGQITAALVMGNAVIAKPAEQTPIIAHRAVQLMHEAGIPKSIIQLLPGAGEVVGAALVSHKHTAGVIFTGSTQTAHLINQSLAQRQGPIMPLIAETGGLNAMLVDSSALPEQVTQDVIHSAFGSAGQRCSALRVLFLQNDIADKILNMLTGALAEVVVGDPAMLSTDVGPVIDNEALSILQKHSGIMSGQGQLIAQAHLPNNLDEGYFFAPSIFEIKHINELEREVFGPILHVIRYDSKNLDSIIQSINDTGYGLTLGIHSRILETVDKIQRNVHVGNVYVNRNMIGAVVGVQPFGGEGLSGTGPKAGGPNYLHRLCAERSLCVNTTAAGGNASLLSLEDD